RRDTPRGGVSVRVLARVVEDPHREEGCERHCDGEIGEAHRGEGGGCRHPCDQAYAGLRREMGRFARDRSAGEGKRGSARRLFYALVFVFAITQVSHLLLDNLTWSGAGQASLCLLVVWWAWNYTTWVTNELDPDSPVVRLVLIGIMLASLLMAVAIPDAFGARG